MTRTLQPAAGPSPDRPTLPRAGRHSLSVLSVAVAIALAAAGSDVHALALGRLNVQSALGEPLRAEIDVTEISTAEADGLKVSMASREAFQAAGVSYNDALANVRATLQRRADGRYVVRLAGSRPLSEPFVDILLEANWASGRIVRDYTLLLDPPGSRQASAAPVAPVPAQVSPSPVAPRAASGSSAAVAAAPAPVRPRPAASPPAERQVLADGAAGDQQVTVRRGDTAGRIAATLKPADVSLDQMLVALLRANPDAFIGGNVNRVRAGAVLQVPSAAAASSVPADEARRTVVAQSRNFNAYRRQLAENAPTSRVAGADRQSSGKLQANVDDRNAASTSPDKLTVSQGSTARAAEDKIAQTRQAQDAGTRTAELSRNIDDLNKLQNAGGAKSATSGSAATTSTAQTPAPAVPTPATPAPAVAETASTPVAASAPAAATAPPSSSTSTPSPSPAASDPATASPAAAPSPSAATAGTGTTTEVASPAATPTPAPAAPPAAAKPAPKKPQVAEPGFFDQLMENPLMLAAGVLLLGLIGFLLYRVLGRKKKDAADSVFPESRLPRDSFFNTTGGESVDTKGRSTSMVSSLSYSPSQLDAGDVDPVAEADVYLAYGRDLQAEEILREALRATPERTAIHLKLLEIHAKRRDLRAFEALAIEVQKLTGGSGTDWGRVIDMGRELDPGNPLYQGAVPPSTDGEKTVPITAAAAATVAAAAKAPTEPAPPFVPSVAPLDFDLDLAKPTGPAPLSHAVATSATALPPATTGQASPAFAPTAHQQTVRAPLTAEPAVPASAPAGYESTARAPLAREFILDADNDLDTSPAPLETLSGRSATEATHPSTLRADLPADSGFIDFDMSSLSSLQARSGDTSRGELEFSSVASVDDDGNESPQAIKLSLARELQALGDAEGARSLVEEVVGESSGDMRNRAEQLLAELS